MEFRMKLEDTKSQNLLDFKVIKIDNHLNFNIT